jgi:hypothetical protein
VSVYMIFAFENKNDAEEFMVTSDMSLSKERELVSVDWEESTKDEVIEQIQEDIFDGYYSYFVFCAMEFDGLELIEVKNKKDCAS